jgi:hypothetical protein
MESEHSRAAGVWQRQWEEDPLGDESGADRDTLVLWTQSSRSGIYVDIRLPLGSPGRCFAAAREWVEPYPAAIAAISAVRTIPKGLLSKSPLDLAILLRAKSFAGVLDLRIGDTTPSGQAAKKDILLAELAAAAANSQDGALPLSTLFWRRDLDYQPPSGRLDIGVCASEPPSRVDNSMLLRETGDDASYAEGWLRLPGSEQGPFLALQLTSENGQDVGTRDGYWVRAGNRFAYAVGRPTSPEAARLCQCTEASARIHECVGQCLSEAIGTADAVEILNLAFGYVALAGEVLVDDAGTTCWTIRCSTNPELVGCHLFGNPENDEFCCSRLIPVLVDVAGGISAKRQHVDQIIRLSNCDWTRRWEIMEQIDCDLPCF